MLRYSSKNTLILSASDIDSTAFFGIRKLKKVIFQNIDAYSFLKDMSRGVFSTCDDIRDIYLPFSKEKYVYERNAVSWYDLDDEIDPEDADYDFLEIVFGKTTVHNVHCTVHWK